MSLRLWGFAALAALGFLVAPARADTPARLTPEAVNAAEFPRNAAKGLSPAMVRLQIMLDRARFSPGIIDGRGGENVDKAVAAFRAANNLGQGKGLDQATWDKLVSLSPEPALIEYTLTEADVRGPFSERIPAKLEDMAGLERLGYTGPLEQIAERFHTDEDLIQALNPGRALDQPGSAILVPNVRRAEGRSAERERRAGRIEVDKSERSLRVFDREGGLIAFYPASVGSEEKPAPSGEHRVQAVARNPSYTYNPDYQFKGVKAREKFTIAPGPNNPVGTVWIALDVEGYGIHGTPEPGKVGKAYSHGCVRLTNWDAEELVGLVQKGIPVVFNE